MFNIKNVFWGLELFYPMNRGYKPLQTCLVIGVKGFIWCHISLYYAERRDVDVLISFMKSYALINDFRFNDILNDFLD